jgi:glycosyltransferase involved in cell wall biosynthesis
MATDNLPPKVTILVVNYNGLKTLDRALRSAMDQNFPREMWEVLVVDDGSTDGSGDFAERFGRGLRVLRLPHGGLPVSCNAGIREAQGRFLIRLDADDELVPPALKELSEALDKNPGASFASSDRWDIFDESGMIRRISVDPLNIYDLIAPGVLFRTERLFTAGLYRDRYWEEYDLFLRLLKSGPSCHVPLPLYRYHRHSASMTARSHLRRQGWEILLHEWGIAELRRYGRSEELEEVYAATQKLPSLRILAAAHDTGGARVLVPVLKDLWKRGVALRVYASGPAYDVLTAEGLVPGLVKTGDVSDTLRRDLASWPPNLLLVGTSHGQSLEDQFVVEARQRNVPSVGILDSWMLYDERFSDGTDPWAFLPDTMIVMDEVAKKEMVQLGAPVDRLLPLGQPQMDQIPGRAMTDDQKGRLRRDLGVEKGHLVLFLSQDMSNFYGGRDPCRERIGYTEQEVFQDLEKALSDIASHRGESIHLVVKLHPREAVGKYTGSSATVFKDRDPYELMLSADLVVGMDTILLLEAGLMGCPTLSYQPGRKGTETLVTNRLGMGSFCYESDRLSGRVEKLLFDEEERAKSVRTMRQFPYKSGAVDRVVEWIMSSFSVSVQ